MQKISAVVITFNEERNMERCLASLQNIADEIIVVDSFSTDKTLEICKKHGAKIIQRAFEGYIEQKNFALTQTTNDMVLSLDADEALSEQLAASILKIKDNPAADGYTMNRLNNYCGKWIRHSGWYPDKKLRLFNKTKGIWGGVNPHDSFQMNSGTKTQRLPGDILHYSYASIKDHLQQTKKFSGISANELFSRGKKASVIKAYLSPVIKFIRSYFVQLGFLDGYYGIIICGISSYSNYLKYHKLRQLNKR